VGDEWATNGRTVRWWAVLTSSRVKLGRGWADFRGAWAVPQSGRQKVRPLASWRWAKRGRHMSGLQGGVGDVWATIGAPATSVRDFHVPTYVQEYIYTHPLEGRGYTFRVLEIYISVVGICSPTGQLADQLADKTRDFITFQTTKSQKFCQNPQTGPLFCM
jgi:hypothetical protein